MSTVTPLIRLADEELIKKLFAKFVNVYGQLWSSRLKTDGEWQVCCTTWLDGLRHFELSTLRKAVGLCFVEHKDYPPTLGQFVDICLKVSGIPSEDELIECMIRREFKHPLVKLVFDKVDSWALSHAKPQQLKGKIRRIYGECLTTYRDNPTKAWGLLEKDKVESLPLPSKIPSTAEILGFKARLKLYQEKSKADKVRLGAKSHPEWPSIHVTPGCNGFDEKLFNERKNYLIGLDEETAGTLSGSDWYDRVRFIREIEARHYVEKVGGTHRPPEPEKMPHSGNFWTKKIYKTWGSD
jgi:hypothetical protein